MNRTEKTEVEIRRSRSLWPWLMAVIFAFTGILLSCESGKTTQDEPAEKGAESEGAGEGDEPVEESADNPALVDGEGGENAVGDATDGAVGDETDEEDPPQSGARFDDQGRPLNPEPDAEWVACEQDEDCSVIELECCDHCNGGRAMAVNQKFKDEAIAELADDDCDDVMCTMMACPDLLPYCAAGTCETKDADFP